MCGRYVLTRKTIQSIEEGFGVKFGPIAPSYNIAPGESAPIVRRIDEGSGAPVYVLHSFLWGLVPRWSKIPKPDFSTFNARVESVAEKPAYRDSFRERRCLVPADGFYEWKKEGGLKLPWYFTGASGEGFAFAGLWDRWEGEGGAVDSFTVLVGKPNELLAPIHDRMPVILSGTGQAQWLDPAAKTEELLKLLQPYPADLMTGWRVGRSVGRTDAEGPELIEPVRVKGQGILKLD